MKRAGMKNDFRKAYILDHLVQIREVLLDGSFEFLEGLKRYEDLCVDSDVKIDWTRLMAYKKQSIGMFDPILEKIFTDMGITVIRGRGKACRRPYGRCGWKKDHSGIHRDRNGRAKRAVGHSG